MIDSFGIGTQIDCFNMLNIRQRMLKLLFFFFVFRYYGASSSVPGKQNLKID